MSEVIKKTGYLNSFDDNKIYYEVRGEGEPLFLVYGIGCLINHWLPQIKYFSKSHQTIVSDFRGHHKSGVPKDIESMNVDSLAKDLIATCEQLNLTRVTFAGHSFGCQVLLRAYDLKPELFKGLIFINGFASNPIKGMFGNNGASNAFDIIKTFFDIAPNKISNLWQKSINNPVAIQLSALAGGFNLNLTALKDVEIYARGIANIDIQVFLTLFENMMKYDGRSVFQKIDCPCLIISGDKDSVTPMKYQDEMHSLIKGSEILKVPYGSHCTQLDMPDLVNLKIEKFMSQFQNNNLSATKVAQAISAIEKAEKSPSSLFSVTDVLFAFESDEFIISEFKRTDVDPSLPPEHLFYWMLFDKSSRLITRLDFVSMDSETDLEKRTFKQGQLEFNHSKATFNYQDKELSLDPIEKEQFSGHYKKKAYQFFESLKK